MYETFYSFRTKPFALLPDSDFMYPGSVHRTAYNLLEYGLLSQAPFIVLTGDPGMGKTSLLQKLIGEHGQQHSIGLVTNARYDIEHLLPWILLSFGLSTKQLDPVEAYHTFSAFLVEESKRNRRVILIVDEAQSLGSELLEELRLLSNLNDGKMLKLQIVLSGQPDLHALLQRVDMTQFAQRIVVDCHLEPLSESETANYIRHRLQIADGHPSLFTNKACALVHRLTQGNPRLINQVCDITLTYGYAEQVRVITSKLVAQAALDRSKGGILPLAARETLPGLAAAQEDSTEIDEPVVMRRPVSTPSVAAPTPSSAPVQQDPAELYQTGQTLRADNRFREAVEMFERACQSPGYALKCYAQIGLCYRSLGDNRPAIDAFRLALKDPAISQKDTMDLRYLLARALESDKQRKEASDVYRQIMKVNPRFRDTATRLKQLGAAGIVHANGTKHSGASDSWMTQAFDSLHRLIGTHRGT